MGSVTFFLVEVETPSGECDECLALPSVFALETGENRPLTHRTVGLIDGKVDERSARDITTVAEEAISLAGYKVSRSVPFQISPRFTHKAKQKR